MRVLFVTHAYPRGANDAAGGFVLRLAVALREAGVEVSVLAPSAPGLAARDSIEGISVERYRYAPAPWETLAYEGTMAEQVAGSVRGKLALAGMITAGAWAVARTVKRFKPDVIHAHWWFPSGLSCALAPGARPLVMTFHGSDIRLAATSRAAPAMFRIVMRRAAAVTAVSGWLADTAHGLAPGQRVSVAPMPVDTALFPLASGIPGSRVLFVGRLNAQKGLRDLIAALPFVPGSVMLDVVGDGPDRATLAAHAHALGVDGRIRWLGPLPQSAIAPLYRAACAVAMPSRDEGLGLVAVEAMLSGAPVVAYRSGGVAELIDDGVTGQLVEPGSITGLGNALAALASDLDRARTIGAAGRDRMLARFAPASVANTYAALYASVMR